MPAALLNSVTSIPAASMESILFSGKEQDDGKAQAQHAGHFPAP